MSQITLEGSLRAYHETANLLLGTYQQEGFTAMQQTHIDESMHSEFILVSGMPPAVKQVMESRGIRHSLIDWHDDLHKTVVTYAVRLMGHDLSVVSVHFRSDAEVAA